MGGMLSVVNTLHINFASLACSTGDKVSHLENFHFDMAVSFPDVSWHIMHDLLRTTVTSPGIELVESDIFLRLTASEGSMNNIHNTEKMNTAI
jgi:hypothetical protein